MLAFGDLLSEGRRAFQAGDLAQAEAAFRSHLKIHPGSAEATSNLAAVAARREQYPEAIRLYERALKLAPKLVEVRFNLAVAQLKSGDAARAVENLAVFLRAFPQEERAKKLRGIALVESGQLKRGIAELEPYSDDPAARVVLAMAQARSGDERRATELLAGLPPVNAAMVEGLIEYRRERYGEAKAKFEDVLRYNPNEPAALSALGRIALLDNRDAEAMDLLEKALKVAPQDAESVYQLGVLYDRNGRTPEGRRLLARALTLRANYADPHYQLARIDFRDRQFVAALRHLEIAAKILPKQEAIRLLLARTYQSLGRKADAAREFAEVRRLKRAITERDQLKLIP